VKKYIFITFLVTFSLFVFQEVKAACEDVLNIPLGGDISIATSCVFSGDVNGADGGGITIADDKTLTIGPGQTIVWGPGEEIKTEGNGTIVISKGSGTQLKKGYLWYVDADNDNFPDSLNMVVSDEAPPNSYRRSDSRFTSSYDACGITTLGAVSCGGGKWLDENNDCVEATEGNYSPVCDNFKYVADVGYYVSGTGESAQTGCAAGSYTSSTGQSSCATCTAGYRCPGSSDRTACTANTYSAAGASFCSDCAACQTSGVAAASCLATSDTNWGANLYNCTGSDKRCYDGACRTCDGYLYSDGCEGCASQGGLGCWHIDTVCGKSCTEVCSTYGGCVDNQWNDSVECNVCKYYQPEATLCDLSESDLSPLYFKYMRSKSCYIRSAASQDCDSEDPINGCGLLDGSSFVYRLCVCGY